MTGLSLTQAAQRTGRSRRTIGRLLADGKIPGAELRENVWSIPLEGLASAGLLDDKPKEKQKPVEEVADDSQPLTWRERALVAEETVKRLEQQTNDLRGALESQREFSQETKQALEQLIRQLAARSLMEAPQKLSRRDRRRASKASRSVQESV